MTWADARVLLTPHHLINLILSASFLVLKFTPHVCEYVFSPPDACELSDNEHKLLFFAAVVIWAKTKKTGARGVLPYLSTAYMYLKLLNMVLWFYSDPVKGIIYLALATMTFVWFPEPVSELPERITYFSHQELDDALARHRNTVFFVCFFATWFPSSVAFAHVFSQLSCTYALDNLVFGKVDVTRHPEAAERYKIGTSTFSRQLPTLILFDGGEVEDRRPGFDERGRLVPFMFTADNVVAAFDLNNVYKKCKDQLPRFRKLEAKKTK